MSAELDLWLRRLPAATRRFGAGSFLFHQGDPVRVVHRVREGAVHLVRHQPEGAALVLQRAGPGMLLAEASLFSARYHCDAVAVLPTRTDAMQKGAVRRAMAGDPGLAEALAAHLARELQAARLRAEILSLRTVAARLDAWLAACDGGLPQKGGWKHVAAEIGTSAEALYRELARRRGRPRGPVSSSAPAARSRSPARP